MDVIFWGNSQSTFTAQHFEALTDTRCDLVGVVDVPPAKRNTTNPLPDDLPNFVDEARRRDIKTFEPSNLKDPAFIATVHKLKPDLFIAAGYALILSKEVLGIPRLLAANFHASLLPDYRGKHPVFWTLRGGEKWAGLTVHVMDAGIDTGDVIYQVKVRTRRDDTVAALYDRIMDRSVGLVGRLVADAINGRIPRRPQPVNKGSYYSSTSEEDFFLDWNWPAEKIRRYITITPGKCFSKVGNLRVYFFNARIEKKPETVPPGTVLQFGRRRATVATGQGAVSSSLIRVEGGDINSFATFCRNREMTPGDRLFI